MTGRKEVSAFFCLQEPQCSQGEAEGNIEHRGETKLTVSPH